MYTASRDRLTQPTVCIRCVPAAVMSSALIRNSVHARAAFDKFFLLPGVAGAKWGQCTRKKPEEYGQRRPHNFSSK